MDISLFLRNNLIVMIIFAICLALIWWRRKSDVKIWHLIGVFVFCIMMCMVAIITGVTPMSGFGGKISLSSINWNIVAAIREMMSYNDIYGYINVFGNIIILMPLGFFLPLLCKKYQSLWKVTLYGLGTSFLIEFWQLFLIRGSDAMDLALNTLGAVAGYLVFLLFCLLFCRFSKRFCIDDSSLQSTVRLELAIAVFLPMIVTIVIGFYDRYVYFS